MRFIFVIIITAFALNYASAQSFSLGKSSSNPLLGVDGIASNSVTNLHAEGDQLWVGPFLNVTADGGLNWSRTDADSLTGTRNRVFSLDVEGDVVWVGLGYIDDPDGESIQSASGFLYSTDGGQNFTYRLAQLDKPGDTTQVYGVSTLSALDVIVPQQSPPFDIDYDPVRDEVWVAGWASGIRKSTDEGRTWQRVVLPPDTLDSIEPTIPYDFKIEPRRGLLGWLNHMGFSVLVDELGTVWAGTPGGVNRSTDGGVSWTKFKADGTPNSLTGNWVISIEEQSLPDTNAIWMATWNASEVGEIGQFGVTVTRDQGRTFNAVLVGEQVLDFAFDGETVYVAGDNGLFITEDGGVTWRTIRSFIDPAQPDRIVRPDARVFSVAVTDDALWVGTSDGLLKSTDKGQTWSLFRVEVPLDPGEPGVPSVDTFAYPNPFSPDVHRFVRIRYEQAQPGDAEVRIFSYSMELERTIERAGQSAGVREVVWDGAADGGVRLPNGVYFYQVKSGSDVAWGKILLIE